MITGIRGLCNGLGPALYGFVFYLFHVELSEMDPAESPEKGAKPNMANPTDEVSAFRNKKSICITQQARTHKSLYICAPSECHHPRPSFPVRSMLGFAVPSGCSLHPRAQRPQHAAQQLQEAQQRRTEPLTQLSGRTLRGQGASAGGQQRITPLTRGAGTDPKPPHINTPTSPGAPEQCTFLQKMTPPPSLVPPQLCEGRTSCGNRCTYYKCVTGPTGS